MLLGLCTKSTRPVAILTRLDLLVSNHSSKKLIFTKKHKQSIFRVDCFYMVKSFIKDLKEKRLTTVAGAWVYYFLAAVIPIAFLLVTAFGVFGVNLSEDLVSRLPEEFRPAGQAIAGAAENATKGVTVFFVITVIFSCTTFLNQMSKDGDFIYGVRSKIKRGFMRRIMAVFALATLFVLFLGVALLFSFGNMLFFSVKQGIYSGVLFTVFAFLALILFGYAIMILLNRFISPIRLRITECAVGAFLSLSVVVLGTIGLIVYFRFFNKYNAFYGSLAAVLIFLLWAYISMLGLVSGVILNMRLFKNSVRKNKKSLKAQEK